MRRPPSSGAGRRELRAGSSPDTGLCRDRVARIIPTDGRPHRPAYLRSITGDSIGRWEGDTLVVDTTNVSLPLRRDDDYRIYEYACHEANYAVGNILRGARREETDTLQQFERSCRPSPFFVLSCLRGPLLRALFFVRYDTR
jgi:hypothetical protein